MGQGIMTTTKAFSTILIANRGEIACRIIKTAKEQGYHTVAIYSPIDSNSPHVTLADTAIALGDNNVENSYLNSDKIFIAAKVSNADAIHPGYGFFSENADFALRCAEQNITFIGPSSEAIRMMGCKRQAKLAMLAADVPCIPGYEGETQNDSALLQQAERIQWPVMIKASAGGGGRGMRLVHNKNDFIEQLPLARSEASKAFGSDDVILEKALINARHIEVQIFADHFGNVIYLGERDCTLQRRHQKIIEEAPSPVVNETLRTAMGQAAVKAAKTCHYVGAGTVEFLLDQQQNFYFLEMNTRLQVEHPVTEYITGIDLVAWQLNIAAGQPLAKQQQQITLTGHAIEVRLYAEDASNNFMPQTGRVDTWLPANNQQGIRIDSGICPNHEVSPYYDPMLAKIIAYGDNRTTALRRLQLALAQTLLTGVISNQDFLTQLLLDDNFINSTIHTGYIDQHTHITQATVSEQALSQQNIAAAQAIGCVFLMTINTQNSPDNQWSNSLNTLTKITLGTNGEQQNTITLNYDRHGYRCQVNQEVINICWLSTESCGQYSYQCQFTMPIVNTDKMTHHQQATIYYQPQSGELTVRFNRQYYHFIDISLAPPKATAMVGNGTINAPMDGNIFQLLVNVNDQVCQGQHLAILEAMKMEHVIKANCDGTITELYINQGEQVSIRQKLLQITPNN